MRITSLEEYGLRVALCLAREHGPGAKLSATQVAKAESLSPEYASKILHLFKKAGLVEASRGARGGFALAKGPDALSLRSVLDALQEKRSLSMDDFCGQHSGKSEQCVHQGSCAIRPIWLFLFDGFDQILEEIYLSDLMLDNSELRKRLKEKTVEKVSQYFERVM